MYLSPRYRANVDYIKTRQSHLASIIFFYIFFLVVCAGVQCGYAHTIMEDFPSASFCTVGYSSGASPPPMVNQHNTRQKVKIPARGKTRTRAHTSEQANKENNQTHKKDSLQCRVSGTLYFIMVGWGSHLGRECSFMSVCHRSICWCTIESHLIHCCPYPSFHRFSKKNKQSAQNE